MILITGMSGSGKTTTAEKLAKELGVKVHSTDFVYFAIADELGIERSEIVFPHVWREIDNILTLKIKYYGKLLKEVGADDIIEGNGVNYDWRFLCNDCTFFVLQPTYEDWLVQWSNLRSYNLEDNDENREAYKNQLDDFTPDENYPDHYIVDKYIDLTADLHYPPIYSGVRPGFVREKYESLKLTPKDKKVIDLGGNEGQIIKFCLEDGATEGIVVDNNWQRLDRAKPLKRILFNCEYLENFKETCDLLLCTSMIHYIENKDKFVRECSRLAPEFVLETPVNGHRSDAMVPTKDEILAYLNKYYQNVEIVGSSPAPDKSERLVFRAWNV